MQVINRYITWEQYLIVINKTKKSLLIYFGICCLLVLFFWISLDDGVGYGIITFWVVLPIMTIISSVIISKEKNNKKYLFSFFCGLMYMLIEYLTFSLYNMTSFKKLNMPDFSAFFQGLLISIIVIFISNIISKKG